MSDKENSASIGSKDIQNNDIKINVSKVNYNDDYMQGIEPYLESLAFFTKMTEISKEFKSKFKENNKNPNLPTEYESIDEFIEYFKENNILPNRKEDDITKEKEKKSYEENPCKIFDFLLKELHKIYKENSNEDDNNQGIKAPEYDQNKAYISFKEFIQNDKSLISDLFFGEKLIQKLCNNCQLEQYVYKYLKYIKLDLKGLEKNRISGKIDLQVLIDKSLSKFEDNYFCSMCSNKQCSAIKITITKYPKILIIIIINPYNDIRIDFPKNIYNKKYELIAVETNIIKDITNVFQDILKCFRIKKENKKYNLFFKNNEKENLDSIYKYYKPYVLFYKKRKERNDRKKISEEDDLSANNMLTEEKDKNTDIGNNLKNSILNKKNIDSYNLGGL